MELSKVTEGYIAKVKDDNKYISNKQVMGIGVTDKFDNIKIYNDIFFVEHDICYYNDTHKNRLDFEIKKITYTQTITIND